MNNSDNVVEIKNVFKTYQLGSTEVCAIRGLSLNIKRGEFAALIGASGSGKTTLLNLVGSLDIVDSGEILIENVSSYVTYKQSAISEWEFITEISNRADCYILLDINNAY